MNDHRLELADVFRAHETDFLTAWGAVLSPSQKKALRDIRDCRTAALGGRVEEYDCGHRVILYNSCGSRYCPKCQAMARAHWLAEREADLLPVPYFHVSLHRSATHRQTGTAESQDNLQHPVSLGFRNSNDHRRRLQAPGRRHWFLGGATHRGQNLHLHPHTHCVVPGGGIAPDGARWVACRNSFFLPVEVLSARFRNTFLIYLRQAFRKGQLQFHGKLAPLAKPDAFEALCHDASKIKWVVYAKAPFGGPEQVLKYLARYTHRVAISNSRLLSLENRQVTFQWKDYADYNQTKTMTLDAVEFMRRFLLHVLPRGFVRIRQFGFLSNRVRKEKLEVCRLLLNGPPIITPVTPVLSDALFPRPRFLVAPLPDLQTWPARPGRTDPPDRVAHRMLNFCQTPQAYRTVHEPNHRSPRRDHIRSSERIGDLCPHSIHVLLFGPPFGPASAPRPDQAHLHRLLAIHQAQSAPLFCAKCVPNRRTNPTRYNSKPITYSGSVHSLETEALRPEHMGAPRETAPRSASDTRLLIIFHHQ